MYGLSIWMEYLDDDGRWVPETHPLISRGFMNRTVLVGLRRNWLCRKSREDYPDSENVEYIPQLIEKLAVLIFAFGGIEYQWTCCLNEAIRIL